MPDPDPESKPPTTQVKKPKASPWAIGWSDAQRRALIGICIVMLVWLIGRWACNRAYVSDPQPSEPPHAADLADRIDPNTADWQTLAALPQIGEKRAKEIVAYRERYTASHPDQPAYRNLSDLLRIKGVGQATISLIEPYLIFPAPTGESTSQPK